jgi:formate--tetrahydrofolate ligase
MIKKISKIYSTYNIKAADTVPVGEYIAKLKLSTLEKREQKNKSRKKPAHLVLVTAVSPTTSGEGKTTISIGLAQAFSKIGIRTALALREPSLGPVFGMKGGATGGGKSQILPSDEINLHFTGDMHAITSANNLLAAMIDNHIYFGNTLGIDEQAIMFKRCLDMNDRSLRSHFTITAASELMAILCLSKDMEDLRKRIGAIVVAKSKKGGYVHAVDLQVVDAMLVLLKDAIMPNMVQTTEGTLAFVHGGPFANIAHGCNSLLATRSALAFADICITEAGFGADLGAEKFFDIKLRTHNKGLKESVWPDVVVLVATVKSIQSQGEGYDNLFRHIQNMQSFGVSVVVAINRFSTDTKTQLTQIESACAAQHVPVYIVDIHAKGGRGGIELATYISKLFIASKTKQKRTYLYTDSQTLVEKIQSVAQKIYKAEKVVYTKEARKKINNLQKEFGSLAVCIAKNQYSFTDNPKSLGAPTGHTLHVTDAFVQNGAGFVTVLAGTVYTMPGLSKSPAAEKIVYTQKGEIKNLK